MEDRRDELDQRETKRSRVMLPNSCGETTTGAGELLECSKKKQREVLAVKSFTSTSHTSASERFEALLLRLEDFADQFVKGYTLPIKPSAYYCSPSCLCSD